MARLFLEDPIHPVQMRAAIGAVDEAMERFYAEVETVPLEHIVHKLEDVVQQVGLQASMAGREYANEMTEGMVKTAWVPTDWSWQDDAKQIISHLKLKPKQYIMDKIHHALMTGEGPPVEELAKNLGYETGKAIARTVVMNIYIKSALKKWDEDGIQHVKRLEMEDNKTCPICRALNGKEYLVSELLQLPNPQSHDTHENCLLGETPILAPGARKSYVGLYKGPAIEVVFEGGRVITTPNHMFLTPTGFASSACLRKGDDIFYYLGFEGPVPGANPDDYREPSPIKDVVHSLSKLPGMISRSVPSSPKDLHGDGMFFDGNIDIVSSNGLLGGNAESRLSKKVCEDGFGWANSSQTPFSRECDLASMLFAMAGSTDCGVGIRRQGFPFIGREPLHSNYVCLTASSNLDASITKPFKYELSGYAKAHTDGLCRFPLSVCLDDVRRSPFVDSVLYGSRLKRSTNGNASLLERPRNNLVRNSEALRYGVYGFSKPISFDGDLGFGDTKSMLDSLGLGWGSWRSPRLDDDSLDDCMGHTEGLGDVANRFSRIVSTRKVLEVNVIHPSSHGLHMYDIETSSSLYIANGLVSSNCRGTMTPVINISTYAPKDRGLPDLKIKTKYNEAQNVPIEMYSMLKQIMHKGALPFNVKFDSRIKADYKRDGDDLIINPKTLADEDLRELIYSEQAEEMWPQIEQRVISEYLPLLKYGFAKTSRSWDTPKEAFINNWIAYKLGQAPFNKDIWGQAFMQSIARDIKVPTS